MPRKRGYRTGHNQVSPRAFGMYRHVLRGSNRNIIARGKDKFLLPRRRMMSKGVSVMRPKKITIS